MESNVKIRLKDKYRDGYPLVNLKKEHFIIQDGYKFSTAIFTRPKKDERVGVANITLINEYGDLIEREVFLQFEYTEEQRINQAMKPESFKLRDSALINDNPKKISEVDVVNIFEDFEVASVSVKPTDKEKI